MQGLCIDRSVNQEYKKGKVFISGGNVCAPYGRIIMEAKTKRYALCIVGTILWYIGTISSYIGADFFDWTTYDTAAAVLMPIGLTLTLWGCYLWAKKKGRSGWWCLMGLLAPIGYIVLMNLRDDSSLIKDIGEGSARQIQTGFTEIPTANDNRLQKTKRHTTHFCSVCGSEVTEKMAYCPNCGERIRQ